MRYLWLLLALLAGLIGAAVGRLLKLQPPAVHVVIMVPMFLALFPFLKPLMPKARFVIWVLVAVGSTVVGWLIYVGFGG